MQPFDHRGDTGVPRNAGIQNAGTGSRFDARRPLMAAATALLIAAFWLFTSPVKAESPDPAVAIKAAVEGWLNGRYQVEEVRKTPLSSMYEVRIGTDFIYVDEKAQFAFIEGNLVDLKANRNLTRERTDEVLTINFKDLPLNLAIKQVAGNGKRVMAVFEDPNCGYCKNMRRDLVKLDNVTIYTFVLPILAADSDTKARKALCAPDKVKAWNDMMLTGKVPENAGSCDTPVAKVLDLGRKLGISATPTLFFANGKRLRGYAPPSEFEKMLTENSAKS